jgi:SAM-dependent methyltransferase
MRLRALRFGLIAVACVACTVGGFAQDRGLDDYKNNLAPYVNSPGHAVDKMLEMADLKTGQTLYDLGCGDGRILIAAAKRFKVNAVGIEISNHLVKRASENVKKAGLQERVKVLHGNFMETDLTGADVVTLYLATAANESLRPNLEKYLRPNARVVSYDYPIPGWKPVETSSTDGLHGATHTIYLYEVPNSILRK